MPVYDFNKVYIPSKINFVDKASEIRNVIKIDTDTGEAVVQVVNERGGAIYDAESPYNCKTEIVLAKLPVVVEFEEVTEQYAYLLNRQIAGH